MTGTLLAPVLSQRSQAKALREDFERQQRATQKQWEREEARLEFVQRRTCYVAANATYHRYRVALVHYLWHVRGGDVTEATKEELAAARHEHQKAFAEAQMIASAAVLEQLDDLAVKLGVGYRKIMALESGTPEPEIGSFEEIREYLRRIWSRWEDMRSLMRVDLEASNARPNGTGMATRTMPHPADQL
ncbi:hypothetical protein ABZ845_06780 [Streptomyces sp. NPDC047022]|uniref:hypothetical protein n=1 Tax=Streptomyces sp. NPDC047022 TaxID=3155737 RepID=UPI0033DCF001